MALDAETAPSGLVRKVQKALGKGSQAARSALRCSTPATASTGLKACPPTGSPTTPARRWSSSPASPRVGTRSGSAAWRQAARARCPRARSIEILNDDMPFLVDSVLGELQARGLAVRLLLHPIFKTQRDKAGRLQDHRRHRRRQLERRAPGELHRHPPARRCRSRRRAIWPRRSRTSSPRCASWSPTGGRCCERLEAGRNQLEGARRTSRRDLLAESIAFLEWLEQANFTFLGSRELRARGRPRHTDADTATSCRRRAAASACCAIRSVQVLRRGSELVAMTPEVRRFFFAPAPLIITKANVVEPRAPARAHGLHRHQDLPRRRQAQGRDPLRRPVHLAGLRQLAEPDPAPAPQGRDRARGLRLSARQPRRQGAAQRSRHLPARRAVPDRRRASCRRGARASSISRRGRACACSRASTASTASCRCSSSCRATATTRRVRERIGALLAEAYKGRVSAFYPYFPEGPLVRVQFIVGRYDGADAARRRRRAGAHDRRDRAHLGGPAGRCHRARRASRAEALQAKYGTAFSAGYAETFPAERALEDIERIERLGPDQPVAIDFYREPGMRRRAASTPPSIRWVRRSACPSACRCWRTWASRPSTSAPITSARASPTASATWRCTTWCWRPATAPPSSSSATTSGSRAASSPCSAARPTTTASTA